MENVDLNHAKAHLEDLITRAASGEDVRISDPKFGTVRLLPMPRTPDLTAARITDTMEPFVPLKEPRKSGRWKGKLTVPDNLFDPMTEEELNDWYGEADEL
jgi:antitoxin (DNA-binding transcriptional repressor) of toxin-antitoxin stability system